MKTVHIQKLHPAATVPSYAHVGDAGMDLCTTQAISLRSQQSAIVPTGIACKLPRGTVGLIWDKSGLATKHGLKVLGGVIDEGYRGEIMVGLINLGKKTIKFEAGNKVAQMLIQDVQHPVIKIVSTLASSQRGSKGFGSSGK